MEVRKGYKQTEVGIIPDDWEATEYGDNLSIMAGLGFKKSEYRDIGIRLLRIDNVSYGQITWDSIAYLPLEYSRKFPHLMLEEGDILLALNRPITNDQLKIAKIRSDDLPAILYQRVGRIGFTNNQISKAFAYHILRKVIRKFVEDSSVGSDQPFISTTKLKKVLLSIPPTLAEQEAIAEALSDADALIEAVEQLLTKKRQVKQGAMSELLTGKKRLVESGEWKVKTFGELFNFSGGFTASRDQLSSDGYCYLHYGDIHMSKKTFVDVQAEFQDIPKLNIPLKKVSTTSLLEDGDIVFVDASEDDEGASRHVVIVNPNKIPYISGLHTIVAKSKTDELEKQYRRYCFQTREVKNQFRFYAVGTKVSGISKTNIAKINLPVPSLAEQTAIAEILSDMDTEVSALEEKLVKARQVKAGMMSELLTGKVRLV